MTKLSVIYSVIKPSRSLSENSMTMMAPSRISSGNQANPFIFFRCDQCPYAFYTNSHLTRHMEIHKKAKHKCPECGCGFKTKTRMTFHVKNFHPEKAVTIPCHICNKTYSDKYLLQLHVKKVHECREEDTSSHLTRHMAQAHEGRKEDKKYR